MKHPIPPSCRSLLLRLPWLLLLPLGLLLPRLFAAQSAWVEQVYVPAIYPAIRAALTALTGWFPFSLAEFLLYALVAGVPLLLVVQGVRALARRIPATRFFSTLLSLCILGGVLVNLFYATWGLLYFREPLSKRMGLSVEARPVEELAALTECLARHAAALRELVEEDAAGVFTADVDAGFDAVPAAYAALAEADGTFAGSVSRVKRVTCSRGLSWLGISGIYIGLTAEANVNVDQPPLLLFHSAAHETAHQLGLASENEADFVAFLACMRAEAPAVRYSGAMLALIRCANALYAADAERYFAIVDACYSDGMRRDLADYSAYWDAFEGPAQEAASDANDSYLKYNAQPSGVKSYGEAADLLLALYAAGGEAALFPEN